jgi:hypothetical protein
MSLKDELAMLLPDEPKDPVSENEGKRFETATPILGDCAAA